MQPVALLFALNLAVTPAPAPLNFEIPVAAGRVHASVPVRIQFTERSDQGHVSLTGQADLGPLDRRLDALIEAAIGPRPECKLQIDLRRAWLSAPGADRVALDLRGRVMQPLCGKLRQVLGGPLEGPSSAANASVSFRIHADGNGKPVVWVERVQLWTDTPELDAVLHAWRPPEEIRLDLQERIDEALANWPPGLLAGFEPRLRRLAVEEQPGGGLRVVFRGDFKAGLAQWFELLGRMAKIE